MDKIVPIKAALHLSNTNAISKERKPVKIIFLNFPWNKYKKTGTVNAKNMAVTLGLLQLPVTLNSLLWLFKIPKNCPIQYIDSMVAMTAIPIKNCLNLKLGILKRLVALISKKKRAML